MSLILTILTAFRIVVIPVQFEDKDMERSAYWRESLVSEAQTYFNSQFKDRQSFSFVLTDPVRLSNKESYYGEDFPERYDVRLDELVIEASRQCGLSIDFKSFCNREKDEVDHIMFLTAGPGQDEGGKPDSIYPRTGKLSDYGKKLSVQGCRIDSFSVSSEYSPGVFCHEFCHFLGLKDMYDTDGEASGGLSDGLNATSIMDDGCKRGYPLPAFNAIELEQLQLGLENPVKIGLNTLTPLGNEQRFLRLRTSDSDEYYLIEYREGMGLVSYHIDKSQKDAGYSDGQGRNLSAAERWELNEINCRPDRMCAGISENLEGSGYSIKDIRYELGKVNFFVFEPVCITRSLIFQDAAIIQWTIDSSIDGLDHISISLSKEGETVCSEDLKASSKSYTFDGLAPGTEYEYAITAVRKNGQQYSVRKTFQTKNAQPHTRPYIYLNSTDRNKDGSFPKGTRTALRVANAEDAVSITWTMNGKQSSPGTDGLHLLDNGILKARVEFPDGNVLYISKEITIR